MVGMQSSIWEYRTETAPDVEKLNQLGSEGWELVGIDNGIFYLKRPGLNFRDRVTLDQKRHYYEQVDQSTSKPGTAR
jgi:hypothetical protein